MYEYSRKINHIIFRLKDGNSSLSLRYNSVRDMKKVSIYFAVSENNIIFAP